MKWRKLTPKEIVTDSHGMEPVITAYANTKEQLKEQFTKIKNFISSNAELGRNFSRIDLDMMKLAEVLNGRFPLGVFLAHNRVGYITLPTSVQPIAVIAPSFHVKPILKWQQRDQPFSIVLMNECYGKIFLATSSEIKLIDIVHYRRFRSSQNVVKKIDEIVETTSPTARSPVVLAGDMDLEFLFRRKSRLKNIIQDSVIIPADYQDMDSLHKASLLLLEPFFQKKEQSYVNTYYQAEQTGLTVSKLSQVIQMILRRRVRHLFVSKEVNLWANSHPGNFFPNQGNKILSPEDDILDDLAELVVKQEGLVTVLPKERMPGKNVACAILGEDPTDSEVKPEITPVQTHVFSMAG